MSGSSSSGRPPTVIAAGVLLGLGEHPLRRRRRGRCRPARCRAGTWRSPSPGSPRRSRFSAGTRTSSKKTSLTSKPPSISSIGRSVTPGVSIGKTSIEMPRCFFSARRVGADQAEDPVGVLAERRPGLLAVDDPVVAVADGGGAQRGQVGAGVGLGEALAPPDVEVRRLRQEALLLLLVAEGREDRADHAGVEGAAARARWPAASPRARCGAAAASSPCRPTPPASAARRARRR